MIKEVEGIIISSVNYSESSKILNIFTRDYGIIGVISKGCKNIKNKNRIISENYTYGIFNIYYKEGKISTLISCDTINYLKNIKSDIVTLAYLAYVCELSEQVYKQNTDAIIYDLLIQSILKIEENKNPKVITNILETKLLDYLGVKVNLDSCVKCGNENVITLSSYAGGYICNDCRSNEKIVSDKTIKMLKLYYYVDISKITELKINEKIVKELNEFLDEYYDHLTGLYIRSKKFLKDLVKI